jgi:hypothetical protein
MTTSKPSKTPEAKTSGSNEILLNQSTPTEFSTTEITMMMATNAATVPLLEPPVETKENGMTTWINDKRIDALWCINQNRNSWIHLTGGNWKKLADNSDSAIVALTALASHARQMNCQVNYREENGIVQEMYVW